MKKLLSAIAIVGMLSLGSAASASPALTKLPKTAKAQDFSWTFKKLTCGTTKIGDQYLNSKADGMYCQLDASAKNLTKKSSYLPSSDVLLIDSKGNEYENSSGLSLYKSCVFFLDKVSAGNTKTGCMIYDVPKGTKITKIVISGGLFGDDTTIVI
jgi:hypothetical protein